MDGATTLGTVLWTPGAFAVLVGAAVTLVWLALAPARPAQPVNDRLDDYLDRTDLVEVREMQKPFVSRAVVPPLRRLLRMLGGLLPHRGLNRITQTLIYAGQPGRLTALDVVGLQLLLAITLGGGTLVLLVQRQSLSRALLFAFIFGAIGYLLPMLWLRGKARSRQRAIARALPDGLDMLTIGVQAGLAFESALLRVGEQWDNALTQEFRRAVNEMRVGTSRSDALEHMVQRTGVEELATFVGVLIQSNQLGVSISQVLQTQAEQMRIKRRQQAEERAQQAAIKIVVVLVFFVFPTPFIVLLGPALPRIMRMLSNMGGG